MPFIIKNASNRHSVVPQCFHEKKVGLKTIINNGKPSMIIGKDANTTLWHWSHWIAFSFLHIIY